MSKVWDWVYLHKSLTWGKHFICHRYALGRGVGHGSGLQRWLDAHSLLFWSVASNFLSAMTFTKLGLILPQSLPDLESTIILNQLHAQGNSLNKEQSPGLIIHTLGDIRKNYAVSYIHTKTAAKLKLLTCIKCQLICTKISQLGRHELERA